MTEKEVQEIYNRLLELTKADKIQWKRTGDEEFITSFSRSSVTVEMNRDFDPQGLGVLKIFNDAGMMVAYAAPEEGIVEYGVKVFNLDPSELFGLIRDKVFKYSETSRSILDELEQLEFSQKGKN